LEDLRQVGKRGRGGWLAGWLALNPLGAEPWVWFLSLFEFRVLCQRLIFDCSFSCSFMDGFIYLLAFLFEGVVVIGMVE